jgi:hypothetical protein
MTYVMTKLFPICKRPLTKQEPTDSENCTCGKYVWPGQARPGGCPADGQLLEARDLYVQQAALTGESGTGYADRDLS